MAILSDIRQKPLFLIAIIGMALFAFVLDPSSLGDFFNASKVNEIGDVKGDPISRQEFAEALDAYKTRAGSNVSEMQASKAVWDDLVRQRIYKSQLEEAGITVGEADIMNALYQAPSVQGDARFQSAGLFDKAKLKEYLATIKEDPDQQNVWKSWQGYMSSLKTSLEKTTYDNLVSTGLGASLKEGEAQYFNDNTKLTAQYVYVPYTSISDSLIKLKKSDIQNYITAHSSDFEVEASRDIKYVKFNITPTIEDETTIKNEVARLLEDETVNGTTIKGLKNTTDYVDFLDENKSESTIDDRFVFKSNVAKEVSEAMFSGSKGDVFGPYKEQGFFKISKITEIVRMPDSVRASHILIPFVGAQRVGASVTQTEEEAKKTADSILAVVKRNRNKFADLAKKLSSDKGSGAKGGDLDWFTYNRMVPAFRDYSFENKKGDIGIVKSSFGFHVIKIDGQKNNQKAVKLVTLSRKIDASETTENTIFQNAETFVQSLSNGKNFDEVIKESNLSSQPAVGLKVLDENIAGLGLQRQIVSWAFGKDSKPGSFKRFDTDNGHVVVTLSAKADKGLMSVEKATSSVRSIILNEKKATLIKDKMNATTLADIAKENSETVRTASAVNLKSPTISGVGNEPKLVGAMMNAKENELYKNIVGDKGVFGFVVTKKELPVALPNYDTYRSRIANERKTQSFKMYEAIKKASNVEDNRANFYGVQ